jgi:hypothetical protein
MVGMGVSFSVARMLSSPHLLLRVPPCTRQKVVCPSRSGHQGMFPDYTAEHQPPGKVGFTPHQRKGCRDEGPSNWRIAHRMPTVSPLVPADSDWAEVLVSSGEVSTPQGTVRRS